MAETQDCKCKLSTAGDEPASILWESPGVGTGAEGCRLPGSSDCLPDFGLIFEIQAPLRISDGLVSQGLMRRTQSVVDRNWIECCKAASPDTGFKKDSYRFQCIEFDK